MPEPGSDLHRPTPLLPPPWDGGRGPSPRIRDIRVILTAPEGIRLVVVKVETDEPDLYGLGCATFTQRPLAVATAIEEYVRPQVIGRAVHDIEDLWSMLTVSSYWRGGPVLNNAMSGIDMALWDIKGKLAGIPLYDLLGGRCRTAATVYVHASGRDPSEVEDEARSFISQGFTHVRCQVAVPGSSTYGVAGALDSEDPHPYHLRLRQETWDPSAYARAIPALFEHLRLALGDEVELLHDIHERVPPVTAIGMARALEPYRLFFLEDPLAPEDNGYFPLLRQQTAIPLAMGELYVNVNEFLPLIQDRLIDFIRVHLSDIGGITPARKLAALCEFFGVRTAWHGPGDVSPVGHAANLHLDLAVPNFGIQEAHRFSDACREVFPGTPEIRDGMMWTNDHTGLGIDIDERLAARFPYPDHPLNGAWPPVRLRD
ncbi:MAG: mandelate racemase/muconate lactonizing enzyme:Mandelate racemase/muconate lactonizing enzyme, partial [Thermomicrobiales bacterium]|nr:mandelate racemase/muconate lactonizing enzyme:Mandelate racemase/muconate lactonizing enzyme [Thermomicrobiales bacterium]